MKATLSLGAAVALVVAALATIPLGSTGEPAEAATCKAIYVDTVAVFASVNGRDSGSNQAARSWADMEKDADRNGMPNRWVRRAGNASRSSDEAYNGSYSLKMCAGAKVENQTRFSIPQGAINIHVRVKPTAEAKNTNNCFTISEIFSDFGNNFFNPTLGESFRVSQIGNWEDIVRTASASSSYVKLVFAFNSTCR